MITCSIHAGWNERPGNVDLNTKKKTVYCFNTDLYEWDLLSPHMVEQGPADWIAIPVWWVTFLSINFHCINLTHTVSWAGNFPIVPIAASKCTNKIFQSLESKIKINLIQ